MLLFNFKLLQICSFPHFSHTCFDILSSNFVYDFFLMYHRASLSFVISLQFFFQVMPLCELRILEIHNFPHFSLTCFDILSRNFAYDFVLLCYRSSSSVVYLRQFLWELCPFLELRILEIQFSALFSHTLQHIELKVCILLCFSEQQIKFECRQFASILELCLFSNLEYCKYSFLQFSLTRFDILS